MWEAGPGNEAEGRVSHLVGKEDIDPKYKRI